MLSVGRLTKDQQIIYHNLPKNPLVSVIMPTYCRREDSLRKSIKSVLNQTFKDYEFIIVDDGSRDGTYQILKEFQKIDSRILIIRHDLNCGLPAIRVNEGLMLARGKYIAYQFDDDEWVPDCLKILVDKIKQQPKECFVYGKSEAFIENSGKEKSHLYLGTQVDSTMLMNRNYIANNSVLHHKSILNMTGLYDPHIILRRCCDYDLWIRMSKFVPFIYVDEVVSKVNAGKKNSLGVDENLLIIKMSNIRTMLEIERNERLKAHNIMDYHVDDMGQYAHYFSSKAIDFINRTSIIPYRLKTNYYLKQSELFISGISRPLVKTIAVVKKSYSRVINLLINNFTNRINNFPYKQYFIIEDELYLIKPEDYDVMIVIGEYGKPLEDYVKRYNVTRTPILNLIDHQYIDKKEEIWASNNLINIPEQFLMPKESIQPKLIIKIAMFVEGCEEKELEAIFHTLIKLKKIKDVSLHIWGDTKVPFNELPCTVESKVYCNNYSNHLEELKANQYDYYIYPCNHHIKDESDGLYVFIEGTALGGVGIFLKKGSLAYMPDELCLKVSSTEWPRMFDRILKMSERQRYHIYNKAYQYTSKNYITEAQTSKFLSYVEKGMLNQKILNKKIAYFFSANVLQNQIKMMISYLQLIKKSGFEVMICLPEHLSDELLRNISEIHDKVFNLRFEYKLFDPVLSENLAKWLQNQNAGMVHIVGYIPTIHQACQIARIPCVNSLFDNERVDVNPNSNKGLINYMHVTSNIAGALWSELFNVSYTKMLYPIEEHYFNIFEKRNAKDKQNYKKKVLICGLSEGEEIKKHLYKMGIEDRFEISLYNEKDIIEYENMDILISNHQEESINIEILRSMASGVFVLVLKTLQVNEMIKDNYNALIFEESSSLAIASRLKQLLEMDNHRIDEILNNANRTVLMACREEYIRSELLHLYNQAYDTFYNNFSR